ncbi:hypothetical protein P691DRAFT_652502, partial [Macrolepiota fuliginosa MF-IS2]
MKEFAKHVIPGAAFDSSARNPPPRSHPRTRLAVVGRARGFIADRKRNKKILWIVGPAGVGKSAIMQTITESVQADRNSNITLGASLFFSINGRNDGTKTFTTLAYQLAVQDPSYRDFVEKEWASDPTVTDKLLPVQFNKFIVQPFAQRATNKRLLITIDGLDECDDHNTQCEILGLITFFSAKYPTAPLVWIIASRPEPHITTFFSRTGVLSSYEKEEITINSNVARGDVECYLRYRLEEIRTKSPALVHVARWPAKADFKKLAAASGGLFAYACTATGFIDDPAYGNPPAQFRQVLEVIDGIPSQQGRNHTSPMANLDALYVRIL